MVPLKLQTEVSKQSPRVLTSSLSGLSLKKKKKAFPLSSASLPVPLDNLLQLPTLTKPDLKVWGAAPHCKEELLVTRETLLPLLISTQKL